MSKRPPSSSRGWKSGFTKRALRSTSEKNRNETASGSGYDPEELALKTSKLRLEISGLQQSQKLNLELIKALATPIALAGIFVTLILGFVQARQLARCQDDARFDQALKRLASKDVPERVSGIVGLELFLGPDQEPRHRATLRYLANALATEEDETVRAGLLDLINGLRPENINRADLTDFLERIRDRNRTLYKQANSLVWSSKASPTGSAAESLHETGIERLEPDERASLEASTPWVWEPTAMKVI